MYLETVFNFIVLLMPLTRADDEAYIVNKISNYHVF